MKDFVLVFDIGSSKLRAMLAGKGVNNTFTTKGFVELDYDGFYEGKFIKEEKLALLFKQALSELDFVAGKNDKVFIGVPAEFSSVSTTNASMNFGDRRKVKQSDIDTMFYTAGEKAKSENVEVVSVNPISFTIDETRVSYFCPVGEVATSLSAKLSVVYAGRDFIALINGIVSGLGFSSVEYISEPLCQALHVISKEGREDLNLLIDVGDLTTSVSIVKGEGLAHMSSFSIGGAFITNSLSEAFDLSLSEADRLKKQVVLSLKGKSTDFYELTTDLGKVMKIPMNEANSVVGYIIDTIGSAISKCVQLFSNEYLSYLPVYLCGGGITKIKGGRDYLAKCLGRNISYGVIGLPGKDKPALSSLYCLTLEALRG